MRFGGETTQNYQAATSREWLLANGLGGYSSSTMLGVNTRKYHGLLVAPVRPPWHQKLLLSKVEEEVFVGGKKFQLSTNEYPGVVYPEGYKHIPQFCLHPFPTFLYSFDGVTVEKTIFMPHLTNAVVVRYKISNRVGEPAKVRVYPLVNSRGVHELTKLERIKWGFEQRASAKIVELAASYAGAPSLWLGSDLMKYTESELDEEKRWYRNIQYCEEKRRGYEFSEDYYCPGSFEIESGRGESRFNLLAAGGFNAREDFNMLYSEAPAEFDELYASAHERLDGMIRTAPYADIRGDESRKCLVWAADSFIVGNSKKFVMAGYHWFSTWGRDSLLSLPGLALVTGRYDVAKDVLLSLARYCKNGLIPNRFEGDWAEYNSADASLLLLYALYKYLTYTDDLATAEKLWPILRDIVKSYIAGANDGIRMDKDGLIWSRAGFTWMDAKLGDRFVTPREGKAVEVNALWYNALRIMEKIAENIGERFEYVGLAGRVKESFAKEFWDAQREYLFDVVGDSFRDPSLRPNQVFAISLPFSLIDGEKTSKVLSVLTKELLTPYGLRTLKKGDSRYRGVCDGGVWERDSAYHQGTVWGWLLGPFITAFVGAHPQSRHQARGFINHLLDVHLREAGLGTVSEIFDGDEPHTPRGCIAQAWSVGEILRSDVEDIIGRRPKFEKKYS